MDLMKIKVEVISDVVGNSVFWEGEAADISEIRSIPAKILAENK